MRANLVTNGVLTTQLRPGDRPDPERSWLFNTDADSHVPPDWITSTFAETVRRGAVAAAGMVSLRDWDAPEEAHRRYAELIRDGLTTTSHRHVYAANLAVRLDAYLRVGGFSSVEHGEDHDLIHRLIRAGQPVVSLFNPTVSTSSRHPGRAVNGLSSVLQNLAISAPEACPRTGSSDGSAA